MLIINIFKISNLPIRNIWKENLKQNAFKKIYMYNKKQNNVIILNIWKKIQTKCI